MIFLQVKINLEQEQTWIWSRFFIIRWFGHAWDLVYVTVYPEISSPDMAYEFICITNYFLISHVAYWNTSLWTLLDQSGYSDQAPVFCEELCSNNSSKVMSVAVVNTLYFQKIGGQTMYLGNEDYYWPALEIQFKKKCFTSEVEIESLLSCVVLIFLNLKANNSVFH